MSGIGGFWRHRGTLSRGDELWRLIESWEAPVQDAKARCYLHFSSTSEEKDLPGSPFTRRSELGQSF